MLDWDIVRSHSSRDSCWVVVSGQAYDVTAFLDQHPGGANSILRFAGKDATEEYDPIHPPGTIETHLAQNKHLGPVEADTQDHGKASTTPAPSTNEQAPLSTLQSLDDFTREAQKILPRKAWIYYSSAADSLSSYETNRRDWSKVSLRPRVLRNVARVSMCRTVMGHASSLPIFIAPAAQARLGHEEGELCLVRGAANHNIAYCTSTYSSVGHQDLAECLRAQKGGGALTFQLYVPVVKQDAKKLIAKAGRLGYKALVVTIDSAVIGKREEDDRYKAELDHAAGIEIPRTTNPDPAAEQPILRGAHSSTFKWEDLVWIQEAWANAGPLILKGIQTVEDAVLAQRAGATGIYLSNHGGRQLDHAPSSLRTLLEIRKFAPRLLEQVEVYVDGGVSRGTDVLIALCLGVRAVGLGRAFMYSLCGYGADGVSKAIQLLSDEIETSMRLLGVVELEQLNHYYVNTSMLELELPGEVDLASISRAGGHKL